MDKIRALAAKKGSMDMSLPGVGKQDKALVDVVLGANGAGGAAGDDRSAARMRVSPPVWCAASSFGA